MKREIILQAAEDAGLVRIKSCCNVEDKLCNTDEWRGNLEGFAQSLLRAYRESTRMLKHPDYYNSANGNKIDPCDLCGRRSTHMRSWVQGDERIFQFFCEEHAPPDAAKG